MAVVGRNPWDGEDGGVRSGPRQGDRRRSGDGPRARLRREGSGAGSGELLQRGKRMWVDAGTVEPHGSDRVYGTETTVSEFSKKRFNVQEDFI